MQPILKRREKGAKTFTCKPVQRCIWCFSFFLKNERKTKKVPKKKERHDDQHFFG